MPTSSRRRAQGIVHTAASIALAENQAGVIQFIPAYGVRHGIIRHKQAVGVFVLRCVVLRSHHFRCELIGVHRPGVGKGNIVQGGVRHGNRSITVSGVYRAGNIFAGEVKPIRSAGGEVELLGRRPLCRQSGNACRNAVAGGVKVAVTVLPFEAGCVIFSRRSQTVGRGSGKGRAVLDNDLNIICAAAQLAAVQIKRDCFQSVRAQCVSVQDFKDRAETDVRDLDRSTVAPGAGRIVPTDRAIRLATIWCVLPPRKHVVPVFDVAAVLVQHRVPLIALGRTAL